ncbi:hypothetical protein [Halogeometricum borinquense]|nr:hypothetical protein [Halogeometricum borinquense]
MAAEFVVCGVVVVEDEFVAWGVVAVVVFVVTGTFVAGGTFVWDEWRTGC